MKKGYLLFAAILFSFTLHAQDSNVVIHLWKNGAPGFENKKNEPEEAKDYWVKNIHNPSLTVYLPPKDKANGAAVIICPGGGHRLLVYNAEGKDPAEYFNNLGITAFVLKYRLFREDSLIYTKETAIEDGRRAMRLIRQRASEWNLDTSRIGLMGFSAGGELAGWVGLTPPNEKIANPDKIDKEQCKADFLILVYPGPLAVPDFIAKDAPPLFMVAANDDACCSAPVVQILEMYRKAQIKSEVHLYAQAGHGFNMGKRSKLKSINSWPQRLTDWLNDSGYLKK